MKAIFAVHVSGINLKTSKSETRTIRRIWEEDFLPQYLSSTAERYNRGFFVVTHIDADVLQREVPHWDSLE